MPDLRTTLDGMLERLDRNATLARDPVRFVRRYDRPEDIEIAGVFASQLAYGRVDLFGVVLDELFDRFDRRGGPRSFVDGFDDASAEELQDLVYRWNRGVDWVLFSGALRQLTRAHGSLESAFAAESARESLTRGLTLLRTAVLEVAPAHGVAAERVGQLPRGVKHWLSIPTAGSACKRWNLFLRWMVRSPEEGIDLGIWSSPSPARLVIPLDTHVHRIARLVGLTRRRTGDWRTAEEVTRALALLDPVDPLRYDFALAHLGISGGCRGTRVDAICTACPLEPICVAGRPTQ